MGKVNWNPESFLNNFANEQAKNLTRAAIFLTGEIKQDLSKGVTRQDGVVVGRSQPGEQPALEEGELRRSITYVVDKDRLVARVGTNKIYGKYLELGTQNMEKRPFLRPAIIKNKKTLAAIMCGKRITRKKS